MPWMAAALPWITAAVGAVGAVAEAQTNANNLQSAADAEAANALELKAQASLTRVAANADEEALRKRARAVAGEQRATIAASGTTLTGSQNEKLVVQSNLAAEQDALNIRYGGLLEAHGLMAKSQASSNQARALKSQVGGTKASGWLKAVGSGLSGYTSGGGRIGGSA